MGIFAGLDLEDLVAEVPPLVGAEVHLYSQSPQLTLDVFSPVGMTSGSG